jgi:hypothetical protein
MHGSVLVDSASRVQVLFADQGGSLVHVVGEGARWSTRRIPGVRTSYADMTIEGDGKTIAVAYAGRTALPGAPSAIQLVRSRDMGRTWSAPSAIATSGRMGAHEVRIARGPRGELHVVWREVDRNIRERSLIRHVWSDRDATRWSTPADLRVRSVGLFDLGISIAPDPCGGVAVLIPQPLGIRLARLFGPLARTAMLAEGRMTNDAAVGDAGDGSLRAIWSEYHPSMPGDTIVRFEAGGAEVGEPRADHRR